MLFSRPAAIFTFSGDSLHPGLIEERIRNTRSQSESCGVTNEACPKMFVAALFGK